MAPVHVIFSDNSLFVPTLSEANSLYNDGYGLRIRTKYLLTFCEVLYLIEIGKIIVSDEITRKNLNFKELLMQFSKKDVFFWTKYMVYRDFRSRGFVVREVNDADITFEVWARGQFNKKNSSYFIAIILEGIPEASSSIISKIEFSFGLDKDLKIAVIDRRGEIVYYSLKSIDFEKNYT